MYFQTFLIFRRKSAPDLLWQFHLNSKIFFRKTYGFLHCRKAIPLTAAGAAQFSQGAQGPGRHLIGQSPGPVSYTHLTLPTN